MPTADARMLRLIMKEAAIGAVYRNTCSDAAAAASAQDWEECVRLEGIARSIERAYPEVSARARFSQAVPPTECDIELNKGL